MKYLFTLILTLFTSAFCVISCSTTSSIDDDELLYIGMKPIQFTDTVFSSNANEVKAEVEGALACAPNGALFGSPYYRTPVPYSLWVWSAFNNSKSGIGRWLSKTIGKPPVLVSDVNPELRSTIAETVLRNNGYFRGQVSYDVIKSRIRTTKTDSVARPRRGKIAYTVNMGPVFTIDSIEYKGFTQKEMDIIMSAPPAVRSGAPFAISALDEERSRISNVLRENGYYYFTPSYSTFLADTIRVPQRVQLQLHKIDSLPVEAEKQWVMGRTYFNIRRSATEQPTDTISRRFLTLTYAGKHSPLRPGAALRNMRLRSGNLFSESDLETSLRNLNAMGIFSAIDITFKPSQEPSQHADTLATDSEPDKLDMYLDCILDKPYDLSLSANYTHKSSGRGGPGVGLSFGRRNALRGGELLSFDLSAAADFSFGGNTLNSATNYDVRGDVTLDMPRLLFLPQRYRRPSPGRTRRYMSSTSSTMLRLSFQTINRTGFYRRNILSAEMTYNHRPNETMRHTFTPLSVDYSYVASSTQRFDSLALASVYRMMMLEDNFIPRMRYTFNYTSPARYRNPIGVSLSVTEAGNVVNGVMTLTGKGWNTKGKTLFNVPVSQFVKLEADWRKTWTVGLHSRLVAHAYAGYIKSYGNSSYAPFYEAFYMGGANDLRGFSARSVGPGSVYYDDRNLQYIIARGDVKFLANLEYRPRLFGSLYGAVFLDAGNVWVQDFTYGTSPEMKLRLKHFGNDIALDGGIGLRYDLDFFVLRLDWGFILHAPYNTDSSGYFNTPSHFSRMQCLNFAIGYPF